MSEYLYAISTSKNSPQVYLGEKAYYSHVYGCNAKLEDASLFGTFEQAQIDVKKLRTYNSYACAVKIPDIRNI